MSSPTPLSNPDRIAALRRSGLLESSPDEGFDRLTRLATRMLGVPVALVSLVDVDRQVFKSCVGLPEPWATTRQTPLTHSFCQHTVTTGRPLVIDDAREHPLLRENLAIPDLGVVAYAGIPLATSDGFVLGSFCAIDTKPRHWTEEDIATLTDLAGAAASEIELRHRVATQLDAQSASDRAALQLTVLAESGRLLVSSLDLEATLEAITRLALPDLAEIAVLDLLEDGTLRRVAAMHADPALTPRLAHTKRFPPRLDDGGPQARAIATGTSVVLDGLQAVLATARTRGGDYAANVEEIGMNSVLTVPLQIGGEALGALSLVRTTARVSFTEADREIAEELARRASLAVHNARLYERARQATRARDDMLGVVSHDLRNPIHTIIMSVSLLQELVLRPDDEAAHTQARVIKRSAERANRLIGDLLDVTHLETGRMPLDRRRHDPIALGEEALDHARLTAQAAGVQLIRGEMGDGLTVEADRDRVLQALGNLIGNALKFTPAGGSVTLSVAPAGDRVRFAVRDTGPGIAERDIPRLFERFWQGSPNDRRGVGLGLSIVRGIAEAHGGTVHVESRAGQGSTFCLELPASRKP